MTLGEFRKLTEFLSDDIEVFIKSNSLHYGDYTTHPINVENDVDFPVNEDGKVCW